MATRYLSRCSTKKVDDIDGSLESASPCPSENLLWLQGTLILAVSRDLVRPVCQNRTLWAGDSTCKLNFENLML